MSESTADKHTVETLAAEVTIGTQAESLLSNEAFKRATVLARAMLYEDWTRAETPVEREQIYAETMGLDRIVQALQTIQTDGQAAQESIRRLRKREEKLAAEAVD